MPFLDKGDRCSSPEASATDRCGVWEIFVFVPGVRARDPHIKLDLVLHLVSVWGGAFACNNHIYAIWFHYLSLSLRQRHD